MIAEKQYSYTINDGNRKEFFSDKESIRVLESTNQFKTIVARETSRYLSSVSRHWDTLLREDVNAKALAEHLNRAFPELEDGWEFRVLPSQHPFDIVSLGLGIIMQVKSVQDGTKEIMCNATVYPDRVRAVDALPSGFDYPKFEDVLALSFDPSGNYLDVLVACINHKDNVVTDYAIVDGYYWGITEEMYLGCKEYFSDLNEYVEDINRVIALETDNPFAAALAEGVLGDAINFKLRKLINLTNPVGRINVLGKLTLPK